MAESKGASSPPGKETILHLRGLDSQRIWDYENGFYWFSGTQRVGKFLNHYELYKMITGLPGDVVECGVYKATSLVRWATFRSLTESVHSRQIVAFDAFGNFPTAGIQSHNDIAFIEKFEACGGDGLEESEVIDILRFKNLHENISFVKGDVIVTVPKWLEGNPQKRIALLHLDMDVYEPTAAALSQLWERMVSGGIVVIDDFNAVGGATRAVEEFLATKSVSLRKLSLSHVPSYFVKP